MRVRAALAALAVSAVLVLGGCAVIPSDGTVQAGPTDQPDQPGLVFIPSRPAPGAAPDDIVRGFVQAAVEGNTYAVAKQFLTPEFAKRWKPDATVLVHDAPWSTRAPTKPTADSAAITLSVPLSARVDVNGVYTPVSRTQPVQFRLAKVAGQWRIASTPNGIVLTQDIFQRTFAPEVLQFWDPSFTRLVPDLRWLPGGPSAPPKVRPVTAALLRGAAAPLRGGVTRSAFPDGSSVRSASGTAAAASVEVSAPGDVTATGLGRMWQQLSASLGIPPQRVALMVNGRVVTSGLPRLKANQPSQLPIVAAGTRFGTLGASGIVQDPVYGKKIAALAPQAVTISPAQGFAAVLNARGVSVVTRSATTVVDTRPGLIAPTVDQNRWTYSIPAGDPTGLRAFSEAGRSVSLQEDLTGTTVDSIEASPDGTRMLVLVQTQAGPQVFVFGIERAADGTPTGLTTARYLVSAENAVDATWFDEGSVAVLTQQQPDQQAITQTALGGVSTPLGSIADATEIVGATGQSDIRARLQSGGVDVWRDNAWQPEFATPAEVDLLAVQR